MTQRKSPAKRAAALKLLSKGLNCNQVAATLRKKYPGEAFSESWVRKVANAPEVEASASTPAMPAVEATPPDAEDGDEIQDTYAHTRESIAVAKRRARAAEADGNHTAAVRFSKQVSDYTLLLARLDKERHADTDVVTIPRAELERVRHAMRERVEALRADLARTGGIVCSQCGREIRIALAKGETT